MPKIVPLRGLKFLGTFLGCFELPTQRKFVHSFALMINLYIINPTNWSSENRLIAPTYASLNSSGGSRGGGGAAGLYPPPPPPPRKTIHDFFGTHAHDDTERVQARSQVVCWGGGGGGAKHVISGLNRVRMYGRAHTARCRVCTKLRKTRGGCGRSAPLQPS